GNAGLVIGKITKDGAHSSRYVSPSICVADVKVYADLLTDAEIANHYNTELATYTPSEIDITFADSTGTAITTLDTVDTTTGEAAVTMNYTENVASDDIWMVAGCYDADGNLLDYEEVTDITAGTLNITVPKGTNSIKVFTWKKSIYMPLRTAAVIAKTPAVTE
ncbi:MAG: hypothetical protein IJ454_03795, partial [Clostridia bacterium]|nr:hypothetical protein [Clostridia bacterium]